MKPILITKADGSREPYDSSKLEHSLERAGASDKNVALISGKIRKDLKQGMSTQEIYRKAFQLLRKHEEMPTASRYSLRRAVFDFGPTGFPFEDFLAEIYETLGYKTERRKSIRGACAQHEVDIVITKDNVCTGIEAKFHNKYGARTDLKVALYVHARFTDLIERRKQRKETCDIDDGMLITNTKFTHNVMNYGECAGLKMLSWNYPKDHNLQDLIEESGLHPITCLTTLSGQQKRILLERNAVLCRSLTRDPSLLDIVGIGEQKRQKILEEVNLLCTKPSGVQ